MSKVESANLILKLYELRRDETMREARKWFISFFPESSQEIMTAMVDERTSGYFRMVVTYWDMAASFVNHGTIDEEMFSDANAEHMIVFSKIEPFLEELRGILSPNYLKNLETLVMKMPNAKEVLAARREQMKIWMQARAEMAKNA